MSTAAAGWRKREDSASRACTAAGGAPVQIAGHIEDHATRGKCSIAAILKVVDVAFGPARTRKASV